MFIRIDITDKLASLYFKFTVRWLISCKKLVASVRFQVFLKKIILIIQILAVFIRIDITDKLALLCFKFTVR